MTFGKDWLIYCASLWPEAGEEDVWRRTFPVNYTSVARIHRPTQFAQALGLGVCEHIGATGKPAPMTGVFHGFKTFEAPAGWPVAPLLQWCQARSILS